MDQSISTKAIGKVNGLSEKKIRGMTSQEAKETILEMTNALYSDAPTPEAFMERIVDRLDKPDPDHPVPLELRILRRMVNCVNTPVTVDQKQYNRFYDRTLDASVDMTVFDTPPQSRSELVNGCYNLAHGISIDPTKTKELMFLFAFAYDMKYYGPDDENRDLNLDVTKNLFTDYYCDSLTRSLITKQVSGASDAEPSGIVIDPKNYVDALFVYFLNANMTAKEKVDGFYKTIVDIRKKGLPASDISLAGQTKRFFKNLTRIQKVFRDDLVVYITANYPCSSEYFSYSSNQVYTEHESCYGTFLFNHDVLGTYINDHNLMNDHACIMEINGQKVLMGIEIDPDKMDDEYEPVKTNVLTDSVLGSNYFRFDPDQNKYFLSNDSERKKYYGTNEKQTLYRYKKGILEIIKKHAVLTDHAWILELNGKKILLAIEIGKFVKSNVLKEDVIGSEFFEFNENDHQYRLASPGKNPKDYSKSTNTYFFKGSLLDIIKEKEKLEDHAWILDIDGQKILLAIEICQSNYYTSVPENKLDNAVIGSECFRYVKNGNYGKYVLDPTGSPEKRYISNEGKTRYFFKENVMALLAQKTLLSDHACVASFGERKVLLAIEVMDHANQEDYPEVQNNVLDNTVFGSEFFTFDAQNNVYKALDNSTLKHVYTKNGHLYCFNNQTVDVSFNFSNEKKKDSFKKDRYVVSQKYGRKFLSIIERSTYPKEGNTVPGAASASKATNIQHPALIPDVIGSQYFDYSPDSKKVSVKDNSSWESCFQYHDGTWIYSYKNPAFHLLLNDLVLEDHVCIAELDGVKLLYAIETVPEKNTVGYPVVGTNALTSDVLGSEFFVYDTEEKVYRKKDDRFASRYEYSKTDGVWYFKGDVYTALCLHRIMKDNILIGKIGDKELVYAITASGHGIPDPLLSVSANQLTNTMLGNEFFGYDDRKKTYFARSEAYEKYRLISPSLYARFDFDAPNAPSAECHLEDNDQKFVLSVDTNGRSKASSSQLVYNLKSDASGDPEHFTYNAKDLYYMLDSKRSITSHDTPNSLALHDHLCIVKTTNQKTLAAIKVRTDNNKDTYSNVNIIRLKPDIRGSECFTYDNKQKAYLPAKPSFHIQRSNHCDLMGMSHPSYTAFKCYEGILDDIKYELDDVTNTELKPREIEKYSNFLKHSSFEQLFALADRRKTRNVGGYQQCLHNRISDMTETYYDLIDSLIKYFSANQKSVRIGTGPSNESGRNIHPENRKAICSLLQIMKKKLDPKTALCLTDPAQLTRTKLIAAYYHWFVNCKPLGSDPSFKDIYVQFASEMNGKLNDAGYAPMDPKNLFDLFVIFLAYCQITGVAEN